jgi:hypothetical protein
MTASCCLILKKDFLNLQQLPRHLTTSPDAIKKKKITTTNNIQKTTYLMRKNASTVEE